MPAQPPPAILAPLLIRIFGAGLRGENVKHDMGALSILYSVVYN